MDVEAHAAHDRMTHAYIRYLDERLAHPWQVVAQTCVVSGQTTLLVFRKYRRCLMLWCRLRTRKIKEKIRDRKKRGSRVCTAFLVSRRLEHCSALLIETYDVQSTAMLQRLQFRWNWNRDKRHLTALNISKYALPKTVRLCLESLERCQVCARVETRLLLVVSDNAVASLRQIPHCYSQLEVLLLLRYPMKLYCSVY